MSASERGRLAGLTGYPVHPARPSGRTGWRREEFGFAKPGEARDFVNAGNLDIDGQLPTNTNGGQLSEAYIHGVNGICESVRLIRGTSVNQPKKNIDHVLVTSGVGVPTSAAILGKA